jgi:signal transduction histidine kinase
LLIGWTTFNFTKIAKISKALGAGDLGVRISPMYGPARDLVDAFNQMADRVEMMVRERDELIQAVSHELGTPLSRLRFQLHLLDESLPSSESTKVSDRIEGMQEQLNELDALIGDAMILVESNEVPLKSKEIDLVSVINHFGELTTANDLDSKLTVDVYTPEPLSLTVDPKIFGRVIDNLLRNASRYARAQIEIHVEVTTHFIEISVEDDGPGIPKEDREKALKPFVRLDAHRSRNSGGAGLGLAIVDRSIRRHQGDIKITQSHLGGAKMLTRWPKDQSKLTLDSLA